MTLRVEKQKISLDTVRNVALTILACAAVIGLAWAKLAAPEIKKQVEINAEATVKPWADANTQDHKLILQRLDRMEKIQLITLTDEQRRKVKLFIER